MGVKTCSSFGESISMSPPHRCRGMIVSIEAVLVARGVEMSTDQREYLDSGEKGPVNEARVVA